MKKEILLIGGGGQCKSSIEIIEASNKYTIIGILDKEKEIGSDILGYKVIGTDLDIDTYIQKKVSFHVSIGQISNSKPRQKIIDILISKNAELPVIKSTNAYVSNHAIINQGTIISSNVFINACAQIGVGCIINTGAIIEHDAIIGDYCHISTSAVINGECKVGNNSFVGSNSVIIHGTSVGDFNIIGAGSVVVKNTMNNLILIGNPAREKNKSK
jgi:sugar O-acyltransferase (sialic acid O-acetyltransferase NeuD family)